MTRRQMLVQGAAGVLAGLIFSLITVGLFLGNLPVSLTRDNHVEIVYFFLCSGSFASLCFMLNRHAPPFRQAKITYLIGVIIMTCFAVFLACIAWLTLSGNY